jgi:hypothetical protein
MRIPEPKVRIHSSPAESPRTSLDRTDTIDGWAPVPWPWIYGDAMNQPPALSPRQHSALSDLQLARLRQWAVGDFQADYDPERAIPRRIEDLPVAGRLGFTNQPFLTARSCIRSHMVRRDLRHGP